VRFNRSIFLRFLLGKSFLPVLVDGPILSLLRFLVTLVTIFGFLIRLS
jgi:hypothetical protein